MNWEEKLLALAELGVVNVSISWKSVWSAAVDGRGEEADLYVRCFEKLPSVAIDELWKITETEVWVATEWRGGREKGRYRLYWDGTAWVRRPVAVGA